MRSFLALLAIIGLATAAGPPAYGSSSCKTSNVCDPTTKVFTKLWTSSRVSTKTTIVYKPITVTTKTVDVYTTHKTIPVKATKTTTSLETKTVPYTITTHTVICSTKPSLIKTHSLSTCTETDIVRYTSQSVSTCTETSTDKVTFTTSTPCPETTKIAKSRTGTSYSTSTGSKCRKTTSCSRVAKPKPTLQGY